MVTRPRRYLRVGERDILYLALKVKMSKKFWMCQRRSLPIYGLSLTYTFSSLPPIPGASAHCQNLAAHASQRGSPQPSGCCEPLRAPLLHTSTAHGRPTGRSMACGGSPISEAKSRVRTTRHRDVGRASVSGRCAGKGCMEGLAAPRRLGGPPLRSACRQVWQCAEAPGMGGKLEKV